MPIPKVKVELQLGGVWTDVTAQDDVYHRDGIDIACGRRTEGARTDPTEIGLTLQNRDGKYSDLNPLSPLYGQLVPNLPIRISMPGTESYLDLTGQSADIASTPDHASLDVAGDIDVRIEATADWYVAGKSQTLISKWSPTDGQQSWNMRVFNNLLVFNWTTGGGAATSAFVQGTIPGGLRRAAFRATLDIDNGSGGKTATLYWASSMDGPWMQFAQGTVAGTSAVFASTTPVEIAHSQPANNPPRLPIRGRVHRAEVRSGIGGTVVAAPDFRALAEGVTSFADSAGRTWTVAGAAAVTRRQYRAFGEVESWPAEWHVSGNDAWTRISGRGLLRRLGDTRKPLSSTLRRRIPTFDPLAYWPMEEGRDAARISSPIPGVSRMAHNGLRLGEDDTLGGSQALPKLTASAAISARVPRASSPGWHAEMVFQCPTLPASLTEMLRVQVTGSPIATLVLKVSTTQTRVEMLDPDGVLLDGQTLTSTPAMDAFKGGWNRLKLFTAADGANTRMYTAWLDVDDSTWWYNSASYPTVLYGYITGITGVWGSSFEGMSIGHLAVFDTPGSYPGPVAGSTAFDLADNGFKGETTIDRLSRLATEENLELTPIDGDPTAASEALGPQRAVPLLSLLEEAADADLGVLFESFERLGLTYRDRTSLYNQEPALTLDYTAGDVAPPFRPVRDTQRVTNDVEVRRVDGSSARAVLEDGPLSVQDPPDGMGLKDSAVELNVADDDQLPAQAGWRLHLGTVNEPRYPSVTVYLHKALALVDDVLALRPGDKLRITNPPVWTGGEALDLIVEGWQETIKEFEWTITFACSPASPWTVGILDDPLYGRIDTDGSELAASVDTDDTVLTVAVTDGPLWTTDPIETPLDVRVGGEVMTVTQITMPIQDRFPRTVTSGWGTAESGQSWTTVGGSASDYSVQGA